MRKGKDIIRGRYKSLKLRELSAVTVPAQEGALMTVMKSATPSKQLAEVAKYYMDANEGYQTFQQLLSDNLRREKAHEVNEEIYPLITAVTDSIRSVIADEQIEWATKENLMRETVESFLEAISAKGPDVEAELLKMLTEGVTNMSTEIEKKLADAQAELAKANDQIADLTKAKDKMEADMAAMDEDLKETKKSATEAADEIFKVGETEIKKSAVGPEVFAVMKAQEDRAVMAELTKVADADYGYLPGTAIEKASVLKAAQSFDEATAETLKSLLSAANEAMTPAFKSIGSRGGALSVVPNIAKAKDGFNSKVSEFTKSGMSNVDAARKVRTEHPELFKAMQDADQAA